MFGNPYYNPESLGLEILCSIEDYQANDDYRFSMFILWRHTDSGKLYWAADSGCSCPAPFESYCELSRLNELTPGNRKEFAAAAVEFAGGSHGCNEELNYEVVVMLSKISDYLKR